MHSQLTTTKDGDLLFNDDIIDKDDLKDEEESGINNSIRSRRRAKDEDVPENGVNSRGSNSGGGGGHSNHHTTTHSRSLSDFFFDSTSLKQCLEENKSQSKTKIESPLASTATATATSPNLSNVVSYTSSNYPHEDEKTPVIAAVTTDVNVNANAPPSSVDDSSLTGQKHRRVPSHDFGSSHPRQHHAHRRINSKGSTALIERHRQRHQNQEHHHFDKDDYVAASAAAAATSASSRSSSNTIRYENFIRTTRSRSFSPTSPRSPLLSDSRYDDYDAHHPHYTSGSIHSHNNRKQLSFHNNIHKINNNNNNDLLESPTISTTISDESKRRNSHPLKGNEISPVRGPRSILYNNNNNNNNKLNNRNYQSSSSKFSRDAYSSAPPLRHPKTNDSIIDDSLTTSFCPPKNFSYRKKPKDSVIERYPSIPSIPSVHFNSNRNNDNNNPHYSSRRRSPELDEYHPHHSRHSTYSRHSPSHHYQPHHRSPSPMHHHHPIPASSHPPPDHRPYIPNYDNPHHPQDHDDFPTQYAPNIPSPKKDHLDDTNTTQIFPPPPPPPPHSSTTSPSRPSPIHYDLRKYSNEQYHPHLHHHEPPPPHLFDKNSNNNSNNNSMPPPPSRNNTQRHLSSPYQVPPHRLESTPTATTTTATTTIPNIPPWDYNGRSRSEPPHPLHQSTTINKSHGHQGHHRNISSMSSVGTFTFPEVAVEKASSSSSPIPQSTLPPPYVQHPHHLGGEQPPHIKYSNDLYSHSQNKFRVPPPPPPPSVIPSHIVGYTEMTSSSHLEPHRHPHTLASGNQHDKGNPNAASRRLRRKCSVPECNNRVVQGGKCIAHGAKRKICGYPGCKKHVKKAGMCSKHGPARKRCEIDGCNKVAVQGGRCIAHGAKKKLCSVEDCQKQAILSGMCKKHHDRQKLSSSSNNGSPSLNRRPMNHHPLDDAPSSYGYCMPADDHREASSPLLQENKDSPHVTTKRNHKRGLSIFQDMSAVNTIIGETD
eukprot:CAMPEP_0184860096 /NCGR_PEP_ID=MMETSP0580-20130426/5045_1 /TAXON_ID=1118495 /ORGANISM="Dactyliosolen fragilissimus" /LENGTH=987 /DNA_ID=CAMNT_0027357071 /DNA_START=240 /DNA_END=3203 /DNA_ORIENTATION=+